jgi:hypothetical protein
MSDILLKRRDMLPGIRHKREIQAPGSVAALTRHPATTHSRPLSLFQSFDKERFVHIETTL